MAASAATRLQDSALGASDSAVDVYERHVAFLPSWRVLWSLLAPFGATAFETMVFASALGTAFGVFCMHRAMLRLAPASASATWLVLGTAFTPATSYFATAAAIHGIYMAGLRGTLLLPK